MFADDQEAGSLNKMPYILPGELALLEHSKLKGITVVTSHNTNQKGSPCSPLVSHQLEFTNFFGGASCVRESSDVRDISM